MAQILFVVNFRVKKGFFLFIWFIPSKRTMVRHILMLLHQGWWVPCLNLVRRTLAQRWRAHVDRKFCVYAGIIMIFWCNMVLWMLIWTTLVQVTFCYWWKVVGWRIRPVWYWWIIVRIFTILRFLFLVKLMTMIWLVHWWVHVRVIIIRVFDLALFYIIVKLVS